jgi:hypothetical protein
MRLSKIRVKWQGIGHAQVDYNERTNPARIAIFSDTMLALFGNPAGT